MKYVHKFTVNASLDDVVNFHRQSASMAAITPPPLLVRFHAAPTTLREGDVMSFTAWLGPLPMRWTAKIESVGPTGFIDRQLDGPFAIWVHRHIFVPEGPYATSVIDSVVAELHSSPLRRLVGAGMWVGLPLLFAFRAMKTKRILEASARSAATSPATR